MGGAKPSRWMYGWCAPPTRICLHWQRKDGFVTTCWTGFAFDVITLPLRERRGNILMLAGALRPRHDRELGYPLFAGFSRKATQLLQDYPGRATCGSSRTWWSAVSIARATPVAAGGSGAQSPPLAPRARVTPPLPPTRRPRQRRPRPDPAAGSPKGRWRSTRLIYSSKRCSNPSIISAKQPSCWS